MALPGYRNSNGFFYDDSNIDLMPYSEEIRLYQEIRNNDPVAVASLDVLKSPLVSLRWDVKPEQETDRAKLARDYIYYILEKIDFPDFIRHYFLKLDFGSCWFEKLWEFKNGRIELKRLYPLKPDTIFRTFMMLDGSCEKIEQQAWNPEKGGIERVWIDGKHIFFDTYNKEFDDPRGRSIYKPIRVYYRLKKNLLQSDARLRSRAAGLVLGGIQAGATEHQIQSFMRTLQGIGNNESNFALYPKDVAEIRLEAPHQNDNNIEMLNAYNSAIFYNTQTQFMMAGIGAGQNGGRANTDSHKGTYFSKVNELLSNFDYSVRLIIDEVLKYSEFADISDEEKPYFETAKISIIDAHTVADSVVKMGDRFKLRPQDEIWFRSAFGMPEIDLSQIQEEQEKESQFQRVLDEAINQADPERKPAELEMSMKSLIPDIGKMSRRCYEIFELDTMKNGFSSIEKETATVLADVYRKAIEESAKNIAKNPENVRVGKRTEMRGRLKPLYQKAKAIGKKTMLNEIEKAVGKNIELQVVIEEATDKRLGLLIDRVFTSVEFAIKNDLLNTTEEIIRDEGGLERWIINRYADGNKRLLADIEAFIDGGIIDGRGEIIDRLGDEVSIWEYTSVLDENVCKVCRPYDGQRRPLENWKSAGIQQYSPVNPGCEGGIKCRCVLVPIA